MPRTNQREQSLCLKPIMSVSMGVLDKFFFNGTDCEDLDNYKPGGYHPVHLGDTYSTLPGSDRPRYRILHKLGSGSFSTVWLAKDLSEEKCVCGTVDL
jgi:serine/threonine protein kinase